MLVLQRILQRLDLLLRTMRQVGYGAILYLTPFPVRFSQQDGLVNFVFALDYVLSYIHDYIYNILQVDCQAIYLLINIY